ncbi:MAG TPA: chemotaxis protein CheB [Kofleriaceae bacterium]|nr:chemotaxis protein CheB [Kofleriaceae bacterium]
MSSKPATEGAITRPAIDGGSIKPTSDAGNAKPAAGPAARPAPSEPTRIVGIGASAGGLESLEQLFAEMPADTGMAFVVVQHLSPDFRSLMDELIARHSEMPVLLAEDGVLVEPNHVYLMPPRKEMIIRERRLVLTDKDPTQGLSLPIDQFFRSLAQDQGPQAVAIVLSGSGSDGSRGIVDIKRAGGTVLAESVASAKFDGMPLSAQATGVVDDARVPRDLARILCGLPPLEAVEDTEPLSEDPAMDAALRLLRDQFGIDFSLYKTSTVARRVQRRVDLLRADNMSAYVEQLLADPDELNTLYQDLLIGVTQFFRDPEAFETLEREVIPQILERVPPAQELRLWIAGCATGEEAYSLAMLFYEALAARGRSINLKILATDVHPASLEFAGAGVYGDDQLSNMSPERLERFFTRRPSGYQISPELRQLIVFARHNVLKDAPFTKMNFISCRNMLIYLQPQAQRTVLSLFHFGLSSGGVLFMGASESPGALSDEFTPVDEHWKIYRKRRDVHLLSQVRLPLGRRPTGRRGPVPIDLPRTNSADPLILATYDQLLDEFMPPSFLLDEQRCLIDSFGGAERMLKVRRRRLSTSILDLMEGELRTAVAGGLQRALKEQTRIEYTGVRVFDGETERRCTMTVRPMTHPRTGMRNLLVSFSPAAAQDVPDAPRPIDAGSVTVETMNLDQASHERMRTLESELAYTSETLQATIEELETSNEEMQATNEELVASNEELQSTNEELHSVNEELYSVNAEYQQKIAELKELNTDIQHLLEGTDVGTLFLDRDLRIRRFTPRIASAFHILEHDIGRQISDFSHNIERDGLMQDIERARHDGTTLEVEVRDSGGTPYFLRILPYRGTSARDDEAPRRGRDFDGVVLTLTNISALDRARSKLAQMSAIVESCDDAIIGKALDGTITSWNLGAQRLYGYEQDEVVGRNVRMLMPELAEDEFHWCLERIRRGEKVEHIHSMRVRKDGSQLEVSLTISPIWDHTGRLVGVSSIARDITPLMSAQRELELAAKRREQFLAMLSHELRNPLAAVVNATNLMEEAKFEAPTVDKCHRVIGRQAGHMARLLDDLLDVSRITRGKFDLRKQDVDLRGSIDAAIESTRPLLQDRNIDLHLVLPDKLIPVRGDASRLQQVVANLLSNAATYSSKGGWVELRVEQDAQRVKLQVSDHGVGIEPHMISKIFDLFVQAEQRIDRPRGGLGVGLSLARSVIELHGGTIEAHSDGPGLGSRFVVRLPVQTNSIHAVHEPPAKLARRCRLVIVEDQQDAREMLRVVLEKRKHIVLEAADGANGIEVIEREHPDAALVDIGLPILNGYEVARQIRARKHLDDVVLIALTGYGASGDVAAAREAGFDHHVCKPAEVARIEELLARMPPERPDKS